MTETAAQRPAIAAFDAVAPVFDERFGGWASVTAQRRAVRRELLRVFPPGARVLELGGGTGDDALFLAAHGRAVLLTDGAPAMVMEAERKAAAAGADVRCACMPIEELDRLREQPFDGAFSNFAAFNCVYALSGAARSLARLLRPGAHLVLVVFGPAAPGEVLVQLARGDVRAATRRFRGSPAEARLGGRAFTVHYAPPRVFASAFAPWFTLQRMRGIGVFVPPSAAEPAISRMPRLLRALERLDSLLSVPLARLGDHVLLDFCRTTEPAP